MTESSRQFADGMGLSTRGPTEDEGESHGCPSRSEGQVRRSLRARKRSLGARSAGVQSAVQRRTSAEDGTPDLLSRPKVNAVGPTRRMTVRAAFPPASRRVVAAAVRNTQENLAIVQRVSCRLPPGYTYGVERACAERGTERGAPTDLTTTNRRALEIPPRYLDMVHRRGFGEWWKSRMITFKSHFRQKLDENGTAPVSSSPGKVLSLPRRFSPSPKRSLHRPLPWPPLEEQPTDALLAVRD